MSALRYSDVALEYLREHAIDPAVAASAGVAEDRGALAFPCRDGDGRPTIRRRLLNGRGPKVVGEAGHPLGVTYWLPREPPAQADFVIVCEAEGDALAAVSAIVAGGEGGAARLLRAAVTGVVSTASTALPVERLVAALSSVGAREVYLAYDADEAGWRATARNADALKRAGMRVRSLRLPYGADLADLLARVPQADRAETLENALDAAGDVETPASDADDDSRLLTAEALLSLPPPSYLIDGLVPENGLSVLYGPSGSGKTFLALDLALSVATGLPWLGRSVKRRIVVYVAAEGRGGLGARYQAWSESRGWPDASGALFLPVAVNLLDAAEVRRLREELTALPDRPGLVVVDTMARTMVGGDENAAKDVGRFVSAVDGLPADATLVVHHPGKDGASERGSGALRAAADLMMRLDRDGRSPRLTLKCEKLKDGPEWEPVPLRLEGGDRSCVLSLRVEREEAHVDLSDAVLRAVVDDAPVSGAAIAKVLRKRKADILSSIRTLERAGLLEETDDGWVAVPETPEPHGNRPPGEPAASGGGGSGGGGRAVGPPPWEPLRADDGEVVPADGTEGVEV